MKKKKNQKQARAPAHQPLYRGNIKAFNNHKETHYIQKLEKHILKSNYIDKIKQLLMET
jgi:hypothetical protein